MSATGETAISDRDRLLEKLRRIEALHAGAATDGERVAADAARQRIAARLAEFQRSDPAAEHQFSVPDPWSRKLFLALLRRYGIRPYRMPRQHKTTVMARMPRSFLDGVFWPEFRELEAALVEHLRRVTDDVIREGLAGDTSEAEEVRGLIERPGQGTPRAPS